MRFYKLRKLILNDSQYQKSVFNAKIPLIINRSKGFLFFYKELEKLKK